MITKIYKALIIYCWLYRNYIAGWVAKFFASQVISPNSLHDLCISDLLISR
jgi:hypothetical protein